MSRWGYFLKRLLLAIPVLFLVITFLFIMLRMGPLSPVSARLGEEAGPAEIQRVREQLGLNDPLWQQYVDFTLDLLTFSGESWVVQADRPIRQIILDTAPPTLWLGFWAILLPLFIGIPLGFYAGLNPNTFSDYLASTGGIIWRAMPNFWLGVIALAVLRQTQGGDGWFGFDWYSLGVDIPSITGTPDLGWASIGSLFGIPHPAITDWSLLAQDIKLILPAALILGSSAMASELRITRTAVLETVNSNYVETAKAKGLKNRIVVGKHIFRNVLIPLIPIISNEAFILIGGSVIVEVIFNINGIGNLFYRAILGADLPLAGALLFIFTLVIIGLNVLQDLLFTIVDPRVGYDQ